METSKILSVNELRSIEREIDEINMHIEALNPDDPVESEQLYFYDVKLSEHLDVLERSLQKARIKELGLRIVR